MECNKCGSPMVIDTWNGWIWFCLRCEYKGRKATDEEIEKQENEFDEYFNKNTNIGLGKQ